jgi:hypothetical protein
MSDPEFPEEEPPTGVVCMACGGDPRRVYETRDGMAMVRCQWCDGGVMTPAQAMAWRKRDRSG